MAWRRSITSSDSSHDSIPHISISSDSESSYDSNTSPYHRRIIRNSRIIQERLPQSLDSISSSFEDDEENVHPADMPRGDPYGSEEEEDVGYYPVYLQPPEPVHQRRRTSSDDELDEVLAMLEVHSSSTGPEGADSRVELQHDQNLANSRVEQAEGMVDTLALSNLRALEEENQHLVALVADLTVQNVMMGIGHHDIRSDVVSFPWMALVLVIVVVLALVLRAWS